MANVEIELNPVDFITVGTVGPKGRRLFHLQAGREKQLITLTIEKEQARALSEAVTELLDDLSTRQNKPAVSASELARLSMDLRQSSAWRKWA